MESRKVDKRLMTESIIADHTPQSTCFSLRSSSFGIGLTVEVESVILQLEINDTLNIDSISIFTETAPVGCEVDGHHFGVGEVFNTGPEPCNTYSCLDHGAVGALT